MKRGADHRNTGEQERARGRLMSAANGISEATFYKYKARYGALSVRRPQA